MMLPVQELCFMLLLVTKQQNAFLNGICCHRIVLLLFGKFYKQMTAKIQETQRIEII
jgi:hypothetical protein